MTESLYLGGNTFPDYSSQPKPTVAAPWMQLTPDGAINAYDFTGLLYPTMMFRSTKFPKLELTFPDAVNVDYLAYNWSGQDAALVFPSAVSMVSVMNATYSLNTASIAAPVCLKADYAFAGSGVTQVEVSLPLATSIQYLCFNCAKLQALQLNAPVCTDVTALIGSCSSLEEVTLELPKATKGEGFAQNCVNLKRLHVTWPNISSLGTAFMNTGLDAAALNELFESLPTHTSGTHNITITGSAGAADCDATIAEQKGWTVIR